MMGLSRGIPSGVRMELKPQANAPTICRLVIFVSDFYGGICFGARGIIVGINIMVKEIKSCNLVSLKDG